MVKIKQRKNSSSIPLCHPAVIKKVLKCLYVFAGMLALFLMLSVILYPIGADAAARQDDSRFRIRITVGGQDFSAELYDNETTRAWVEKMPMTLPMNELNGNEKYHYFSESLPTNPTRPDAIHTGDLMLYGGSCLVLFYKDFVTSYSSTPLGYMEDAAGLAKALGNGNVTVSFRLDDGELTDGKEDLRKLYDEEKDTLDQGYTAQSQMAFEDALEMAKNTLENQNATAEDVQNAIKALENAKKGLVTLEFVLEKEILNYSKADSDGNNYTKESWNVYQEALKEARGLKQADGYTEETMNRRIEALKLAYEGLELQTSSKPQGSEAEQSKQEQVKVQAADGKIILNYKNATMRVGDTLKLKATLNGRVKRSTGVIWKASNKKVASVNKKGIVKAKKTGTVTITVMTKNKKIKTSCKIKVKKKKASKTNVNIQVGKKVFKAKLADNSSAKELAKKLAKKPITIFMQDYGGFEKVGDFGFNMVTNDKHITTEPGDLVLYEGDQLVIFYGKNSWSYTKLGKIQNVTAKELKAALGNGDVKVTLSLP